jgi:hexosaminidase
MTIKLNFLLLLFPFSLVFINVYGQSRSNIIPAPQKIKWKNGEFIFNSCTRIQFLRSSKDLSNAVAPLVSKYKKAACIDVLSSANCSQKSLITITLNNTLNNEEGYRLNISPQRIEIVAKKPAGVFYAIQSVLQLLPENIESETLVKNVRWKVPCVNLEDSPRLKYRGIMLDVSRNFFTADTVKRMIDLLAMQR